MYLTARPTVSIHDMNADEASILKSILYSFVNGVKGSAAERTFAASLFDQIEINLRMR